MVSSPAVAGGIVFAGSYDGNLYAVNASDGKLVWSYLTGDIVVSSPAVADGVVYFGSYDRLIYAVGTFQNAAPNLDCTASFVFCIRICGFSVLAAIVIVMLRLKKPHGSKAFRRLVNT